MGSLENAYRNMENIGTGMMLNNESKQQLDEAALTDVNPPPVWVELDRLGAEIDAIDKNVAFLSQQLDTVLNPATSDDVEPDSVPCLGCPLERRLHVLRENLACINFSLRRLSERIAV